MFEARCCSGRAVVNAPGWIRSARSNLALQPLEETAGTKWTVNKRHNCVLPVLEGTCCPSGTFLVAYARMLFIQQTFICLSPENETGTDVSGDELDWRSWEDAIHGCDEHRNLSHFFAVQCSNCAFPDL